MEWEHRVIAIVTNPVFYQNDSLNRLGTTGNDKTGFTAETVNPESSSLSPSCSWMTPLKLKIYKTEIIVEVIYVRQYST